MAAALLKVLNLFRSATTVSNVSGGSHFLRPKSLAIPSGFAKIWKKERNRTDNNASGNPDLSGTSCPAASRPHGRRKSERKSVPAIRYDFVSAPSTPNSETGPDWMSKHSVSSEIIPEVPNKRSGKITLLKVLLTLINPVGFEPKTLKNLSCNEST